MAFENLSNKLQEVFKQLRSKGVLTEADVKAAMREVKIALLEADVNFKIVKDFIKKVTERAVGTEVLQGLNPGQQVIKIVNEELITLMGSTQAQLTFSRKPPTVFMMVGLQGAGKTTTSGKLAGQLRKQGRNPLLVACDVYRPAAIKQLQVVGKNYNIPVFEMGTEVSPVEISKKALEYAAEQHHDVILIDTAGLRKKSKIADKTIERYSVIRSLAAVRRCDVALIVIDATEGVGEQETRVAGYVQEQGKAAVIIVNKWDALDKETGTLEKFRKQVLEKLHFMDYAPVLFISAKTGQRVNKVLPMVDEVFENANRRVPTGVLNDVIADAVAAHEPPSQSGRRPRFYYATQVSVQPPTIVFFVNDPDYVHFSYMRYMENHLRKSFQLEGTPLKMILRKRKKEDNK